jgi:hypothetical protein
MMGKVLRGVRMAGMCVRMPIHCRLGLPISGEFGIGYALGHNCQSVAATC